MLKKLFFVCLTLVLVLPVAVSCSSAKLPETLLVPSSANAVLEIEVKNILTNSVLQIAYSELAKVNPTWPQTVNDALDQLLQKTGFDISNVSTAVVFADIESNESSQNRYAGIIANGTFNESTLISGIEQKTSQTLSTSTYNNLTIYATSNNDFNIVFLSQSQIVAGTPQAVRDVIDVFKKTAQPLSGSIIDALNRVGSALITAAFSPPQSLRNQLNSKDMQYSGISLTSLQDVDSFGIAINQPVLNVNFRVDAHFTNTTSVQDAKNALTSLISQEKISNQDPNVQATLNSIQISVSGQWLTVNSLLNPTQISSLINMIQSQQQQK